MAEQVIVRLNDRLQTVINCKTLTPETVNAFWLLISDIAFKELWTTNEGADFTYLMLNMIPKFIKRLTNEDKYYLFEESFASFTKAMCGFLVLWESVPNHFLVKHITFQWQNHIVALSQARWAAITCNWFQFETMFNLLKTVGNSFIQLDLFELLMRYFFGLDKRYNVASLFGPRIEGIPNEHEMLGAFFRTMIGDMDTEARRFLYAFNKTIPTSHIHTVIAKRAYFNKKMVPMQMPLIDGAPSVFYVDFNLKVRSISFFVSIRTLDTFSDDHEAWLPCEIFLDAMLRAWSKRKNDEFAIYIQFKTAINLYANFEAKDVMIVFDSCRAKHLPPEVFDVFHIQQNDVDVEDKKYDGNNRKSDICNNKCVNRDNHANCSISAHKGDLTTPIHETGIDITHSFNTSESSLNEIGNNDGSAYDQRKTIVQQHSSDRSKSLRPSLRLSGTSGDLFHRPSVLKQGIHSTPANEKTSTVNHNEAPSTKKIHITSTHKSSKAETSTKSFTKTETIRSDSSAQARNTDWSSSVLENNRNHNESVKISHEGPSHRQNCLSFDQCPKTVASQRVSTTSLLQLEMTDDCRESNSSALNLSIHSIGSLNLSALSDIYSMSKPHVSTKTYHLNPEFQKRPSTNEMNHQFNKNNPTSTESTSLRSILKVTQPKVESESLVFPSKRINFDQPSSANVKRNRFSTWDDEKVSNWLSKNFMEQDAIAQDQILGNDNVEMDELSRISKNSVIMTRDPMISSPMSESNDSAKENIAINTKLAKTVFCTESYVESSAASSHSSMSNNISTPRPEALRASVDLQAPIVINQQHYMDLTRHQPIVHSSRRVTFSMDTEESSDVCSYDCSSGSGVLNQLIAEQCHKEESLQNQQNNFLSELRVKIDQLKGSLKDFLHSGDQQMQNLDAKNRATELRIQQMSQDLEQLSTEHRGQLQEHRQWRSNFFEKVGDLYKSPSDIQTKLANELKRCQSTTQADEQFGRTVWQSAVRKTTNKLRSVLDEMGE